MTGCPISRERTSESLNREHTANSGALAAALDVPFGNLDLRHHAHSHPSHSAHQTTNSVTACELRWQTAIDEQIDTWRPLTHVRAVSIALDDLEQEHSAVLAKLRAIHEQIRSLETALSSEGLGILAWNEVYRRARIRVDSLGSCTTPEPVQLQELFEAHLQAEVEATPLLEWRGEQLRPSAAFVDLRQVLDAMFGLELLRVPVVSDCRLNDGLDFSWDPSSIETVTATLESWRPTHVAAKRALVRRSVPNSTQGVAGALPLAVCEQLSLLVCNDLRAARQGPTAVRETPRVRLRTRAQSLKRALPAVQRLHHAVATWGCAEERFGLDGVRRYARDLLQAAKLQLEDKTHALATAQLLVESPEPIRADSETARKRLLEQRVLDDLRVFRQEIAALAFVVAEPAIHALAQSPTQDAPEIANWSALLGDLRSAGESEPFGASGLLAFEQLRGLILANPKQRCPGSLAPWASRVFDGNDGLFFDQGRTLLRVLARNCPAQGSG